MGLKDKLVSTGVEKVFNYYLEDIGELADFSIDSNHKTMNLSISLKGETEPIRILIREYEILREREKQYIVIHELSASRQWISVVFDKFLKGRKIEIPAKYEFIVRRTM